MSEDLNRKINIWINDKQVENTFKGLANAMRQSRNELAKMTIGSKEYVEKTKEIRQLQGLLDKHHQAQKNIATGWAKVTENIKQIAAGNILANVFSKIGGTIQNAFANAWNTIKDFASGVSELKAITGASGSDLDYLKEKSKDLAAQYGKSAREIVEAMKLVGSAKPELLDNVQALGGMTEAVLTLSKASGMDLSKTTASLTTIMNQFGHSAERATEDINILAAGSKYGSVEVDYLADAISKVGTIANSAGLSLEQTTAVMELFGEKGVRAETAGTGFKKVLTELQKDTKNYTNGVFDLNKAIDNNQNIAGNNLELQKKFGSEFFGLAQILFQNKERFRELNEQVTGTNTAFEQAAIAVDNLQGDLDKAKGTWESFILSIEDGDGIISRVVRGAVQGFTELLDVLKKLNDGESLRLIKLKKDSDFTGQVNKMMDDHRKNIAGLNDEKEREIYISGKVLSYKKKLMALEYSLNKETAEGEEKSKNKRAELEMTRDAYKEVVTELEKLKKVDEKPVRPDKPDSPKGPADKEKNKEYLESVKAYETLRKQLLALQKKFNLEDASEQTKAYAQIEEKYDSQLEVVDRFISELEAKQATKKGLNDHELELLGKFYDARNTLEDLKFQEMLATEQYYREKKIEEEKKTNNILKAERKSAAEQIQDALMTDSQRERIAITKKYEDLISLAKKYGFDTAELYKKMQQELKKITEDGPGLFDIDWGKLEELYEKAKPYIDSLGGLIQGFNDLQRAKDNAALAEFEANSNRKKEILQNQLDRGIISQESYHAQITNLDKKLEMEKKKIAVAEAVRQKKLRTFETMINTAAAVIRFMVDPGGPAGLALSFLAATTGAFQLAAIKREPLPKLAKGARVNKPTIAQVGEAGPEIVLSNKIVSSPSLGPIADDLARIQEGKQPRFLNRPSLPNYKGMSSAIGASVLNQVTNNTVINQVESKPIEDMTLLMQNMNKQIEKMTGAMEGLKYLQAVISSDQMKEFDEDEKLRLRYSSV